MRLAPGDVVRVRLDDPPHHTRVPRYVRGRRGVITECEPDCPLPDTVVLTAGANCTPEPIYRVHFDAAELWGESDSTEGTFSVWIDLWGAYLEDPDEESRP